MEFRVEKSASAFADADVTLSYLERRVREEARAAARASSVGATLIHLSRATAFAKRFGDTSGQEMSGDSWLEEQRVW